LHFRLELVYDFFECFTVRLYHVGKVCWGFGFLFLVGLFISKVDTVGEVSITSIGVIGFTAVFGIGIGDSSIAKAGSSFCSSGAGCSGSFLWVAGVVAVAVGSIVVAGGSSIVVVAVARINIVGFKGFFYEVFVIVLENVVFLQEAAGVGNGHLCLFPSLFVE